MKKIKLDAQNIILFTFAALEVVIYVVFNALSATRPDDPIYLKYAGVLACLAVTVVMACLYKSKDSFLLIGAFVATAISDLFILVLDTYYEIGLVTFIITQSLYLYRLYADRLRGIWITITVRIVLAAVIIGVVCGLSGANLLVIEVGLYIVMLAANTVEAWLISGRSVKNLLFAIGLTLFLCCDICVGLDNAGMIGLEIKGGIAEVINFLIWVFYLPSQVLIALTVSRRGLNCASLRVRSAGIGKQSEASLTEQKTEDSKSGEEDD